MSSPQRRKRIPSLPGVNHGTVPFAWTGFTRLPMQGGLPLKNIHTSGIAQAQAKISSVGFIQVGQTQAAIYTTSSSYSQAQTQIKSTYQEYAQAQTQIRQQYRSYAQSQVHIKSSYANYAQAQVDILQIYRGYAQTQALIKTTSSVQAQAQVAIKQTYRVYAQTGGTILQSYLPIAQSGAAVLATYLGLAQAQATILATYQSIASAQASISIQYQVTASTQASIVAIYTAMSQTQAQILATYLVYANTQAQLGIILSYQQYAQSEVAILAVYTAISQAEVHIFATTSKIAQAQTDIFVSDINVYSQAQAILNQSMYVAQSQGKIITLDNNQYAQARVVAGHLKIITTYLDTFNRPDTTAPPFNLGSPDIGAAWAWASYDSNTTIGTSTTHVENGIMVGPGYYKWESMTGPPSISSGDFYMDFWVPALNENNLDFRYYDTAWYFQIKPYTDTDIEVLGLDNSYIITPITRSSWYRVHATIDTSSSQKVKIAVWKVGDSEPAQITIQTTSTSHTQYLDVYNTPSNEYSKFDNFRIESSGIFVYNQGYAAANAQIKATNSSLAQAQALLNQYWRWAQSTAAIQATYQKYSQSQTFIRKSAGYAQAQTKIPHPNTDAYGLMVKNDGATHLYGLHTSNAYPNNEYATWQDELGSINGTDYISSSSSQIISSPVGPEYTGIYFSTYNEVFYWASTLPELNTPVGGIGQWTIETWVKAPPVTNIKATIFEIYGGNSNQRQVTLGFGHESTFNGTGNYIRLQIADISGVQTVYNTGIQYSINTWYHVAVINDTGFFKVYINGQLVIDITRRSYYIYDRYYLYLNYSGNGGASSTTSRIAYDNLAIYPYPISQSILQSHYNYANTIYYGQRAYASASFQIGNLAPGASNKWQQFAQASHQIGNLAPGASNKWQQFAQATVLIIPSRQYAQALARITDAVNQQIYAQAQTVIIPVQGMLRYFIQSSVQDFSLADSGLLSQITSMTAVTDPAQINDSNHGDNYGLRWQSWFVADTSGDWWFQTHSDDASGIFIYAESLQLVGTVKTNYPGGSGGGTASGTIALIAGTKYKIDVKYGEGGGSDYIDVKYRRPIDPVGSEKYLLAGSPPWNDKSNLPFYSTWGIGYANAYWIDRNGEFYVRYGYAQTQTKIWYPEQKGYGQALTQVGAFKYAQAITQIAYEPATVDYRVTVLADKPILYYPMDEYYYGGNVDYTASTYYDGSYLPSYAADGNTNDGWASSGYSAGNTWWEVGWGAPQTIRTVRVTNRPSYTMGSGRIIFSTGDSVNVTFPTGSRVVSTYNITPVVGAIWMRLISDSGGNSDPGFSEVEAFNEDSTNLVRFPVIPDPSSVPPAGVVKTIVGRRNATWGSATKTIFRGPSAIITGTSVDFNSGQASVPAPTYYSGYTTEALTFPGAIPPTGNWKISNSFWLNAGDTVTITLNNVYKGGSNISLGLNDLITNDNPYEYIGVGPNTGTYTRTAGQTGVHYVYIYPQGTVGPTGSGTITYPNYQLSDSAIPVTDNSIVTVEAWIKPSITGGDSPQMFFGFDRNYVGVWSDGRVGFGDGAQGYYSAAGVLTVNNWYHVVAVFHSFKAANTSNKLYVNGALRTLAVTGANAVRSARQNFSISGWPTNASNRWLDSIDELAVFNYELTQEQILAHYRSVKKQVYGLANAWARGRYSVHANAQVFGGRQPDGWYHDFNVFAQALTDIIVHDNTGIAQAGALIQTDYGLTRMTWNNAQWVVGDIFNWGDTEWELGQPNYSDSGNHPSSYPGNNNWGMAWSGNFIADAEGLWQFRTSSDDGSDLWISGTRVVDNKFGAGHGNTTVAGSINLIAGNFYTIHTRFGQGAVNWNISIQYKRPADAAWYYLTDNAPPWIRKYWQGGFAQATAEILPTPNVKVFAQAQAKLNSFNYPQRAQAQTDILQTYSKYAQALAHVGWLRLAQAQARLIAFDVPKHASAKAHIKAYGVSKHARALAQISRTQHCSGNAAVAIKQTYPFRYISTNYGLTALGATVTPDPNFSMEETVPENTLDGSPYSVWTNFLAIDAGADQYFYLNLDLGVPHIVSSYYILPVKYNVTANLQYSQNGSTWIDIVTDIYFDVKITYPISYSHAITGEITPTTARYWRLKFTNGGDDSKVSIGTFQLGIATTQNPTFAQAQAFFGRFGIAQAMSYTSPGLSTYWAQAGAHIKTTSTVSGNAQCWYLPPTAHGLAQALIVQVYKKHGQAMAWALPPTAFGLSQVQIKTTYTVHGASIADIRTTYGKYAMALAQITKCAGHAQAMVRIYRRSAYAGQARVFIGHFVHGIASAFIVKSKAYGQSYALIKNNYGKYGQALALIRRSEVYSLSTAQIKRTYEKYGLAATMLNQHRKFGLAQTSAVRTYMRPSQAMAKIRALSYPCAEAQCVISIRPIVRGQAEAFIQICSKGHGLAMAQIGSFKYAQAQTRVIAFNVPKVGNAAGYILVDITVLPPHPTSDVQSYLIMYNNQKLPGYAQKEFLSSTARLSTTTSAYNDRSLIEYLGLENKEIELKMLVWEPTYLECKIRVQEAASILRSKRKAFSKLYIQNYNKYYEAMVKSIKTDKSVPSSTQVLEYDISFEARPWLISNDLYTLVGTGSIETTDRTLRDGGWTPAWIMVSGTDVTISGVTEYGESTGSIAIEGTVSNYIINSEYFETSDNSLITPQDYGIYVGPGKTIFTITGATDCRIEYHNRWYI